MLNNLVPWYLGFAGAMSLVIAAHASFRLLFISALAGSETNVAVGSSPVPAGTTMPSRAGAASRGWRQVPDLTISFAFYFSLLTSEHSGQLK